MTIKYLFICIFLLAATAGAADLYMDPTATGNNDGSDWPNAFEDVAAMQATSGPGDTIHVRNIDTTMSEAEWPERTYMASALHQFGITWTFDTEYQVGQFCNRDYWVIPNATQVTINSIDPCSLSTADREKNGSMLNIDPTDTTLGYDEDTPSNTYDSSYNVALDVDAGNPLVIDPCSSLVSTISFEDMVGFHRLSDAAVLTILPSAPPWGSFRPGYADPYKWIKYNESDIDYETLADMTPSASEPSQAEIERHVQRCWLDHKRGWSGEYIHPKNNMEDYPRDISQELSETALWLNSNHTNSEKRMGTIGLCQIGLDDYGIIDAGAISVWRNMGGGFNGGQKFRILFAGIVLDDADMKAIGAKSGDYGDPYSGYPADYIGFTQDDQIFYVEAGDVNSTPYTYYSEGGYSWYGKGTGVHDHDWADYTNHHIGMPEWGQWHGTDGARELRMDGLDWTATYRQCCTARTWGGYMLAAHAMGMKSLWNEDAVFDYQDRYWVLTRSGGLMEGWSYYTYIGEMWNAHRSSYSFDPCDWNTKYDFVAPGEPIGVTLDSTTPGSGEYDIYWTAPSTAVDGDDPCAYRICLVDPDTSALTILDEVAITSYTRTGWDGVTTETLIVYSLDDVGIQSPYGDSVSTDETPDPPPDSTAPTGLAWSVAPYAAGSSSISMAVSEATDASPPVYYDVEWSPNGTDTWTSLGEQTTTSFTHSGLSTNTTYYYRARARDSAASPNYTSYLSTQSATTTSGASGNYALGVLDAD